jgi:hypothetical protein
MAKGGGKRIQDIYCWGDPFCEFVVNIPGLRERGDLVSKDGEDGLGGIAGLKGGKEWMRGKVFLSLSFVCFQRSVENAHKVGLRRQRGGCRGDCGHTGSWRRTRLISRRPSMTHEAMATHVPVLLSQSISCLTF